MTPIQSQLVKMEMTPAMRPGTSAVRSVFIVARLTLDLSESGGRLSRKDSANQRPENRTVFIAGKQCIVDNPEWFLYGCTQKRACPSLPPIYGASLISFHDRLAPHTTVNL